MSIATEPETPPAKYAAINVRSVRAFLMLIIAMVLALSGTTSTAALAAPVAKPPPPIWGACSVVNREAAELKVVRRFDRAQVTAATGQSMPAGTSDLLCGTANYGYYHILARHYGEWTQKSVVTNENWREVADYAIAEALRTPTVVVYRPDNDTFCYSREISLIDKVRGITVDVMNPSVVVRAVDGTVITAYPTRVPC